MQFRLLSATHESWGWIVTFRVASARFLGTSGEGSASWADNPASVSITDETNEINRSQPHPTRMTKSSFCIHLEGLGAAPRILESADGFSGAHLHDGASTAGAELAADLSADCGLVVRWDAPAQAFAVEGSADGCFRGH